MPRTVKNFWWLVLLACGLQAAMAFVPSGPIGNGGDAWQTPAIGYGLAGDLVAPKNIGEEYRRNTPVMYYTMDANFLEFFGSNGIVAVDGAFSILNTVTNVSTYDPGLSQFPLYSQHVNYTAQALGLSDLQSTVLGVMTEQLGLADPIRYVWTLRSRIGPATGFKCPFGMTYEVVQRNLDILTSPLNQVQYSPYINDTLYSYTIAEFCAGNPLAITVPFPEDPYALIDTPVASFQSDFIDDGYFYSSLTRDDVAGLRYLLSTNNVNMESVSPDSLLLLTNLNVSVPLTTSNLEQLLVISATNSPVTLATLYPGITVASTTNSWIAVCTPNITSYLTNYYGAPAGSVPTFVIVTNGTTCTAVEVFSNVFGNVITNGNLTNFPGLVNGNTLKLAYSSSTKALLMTTVLTNLLGAPAGSPPVTNTTVKAITITNQASGEYFVLPPGFCGMKILSPQPPGFPFANVVYTTNVVTAATNVTGFADTESIVTAFTNHTYIVQFITCSTIPDVPRLRQGIDRIQFVRANYDSLIGQFFQPVTNNYSMTIVTNSQLMQLNYQRIVTTPDFLFSAADIGGFILSRNVNFNQANILPGLAGPGTIDPPTTITLNKDTPLYVNLSTLVTNVFVAPSELSQAQVLAWGSFDQSTNPPVIYPNGTSIDNLGNMIVVQITPPPPILPAGTVNTTYSPVTFTATGGAFTPPYTWSATGLPSGLSVSSGGTLSGFPTQAGTYDFTLTMTDSLGRSVQWGYSITIIP